METKLSTVFVVAVLTTRMIMPGMPDMPAGMKIPGMEPTRSLTMTLTSGKDVDAKSKAQCAIPEGLKLGPKVDLQIDLPTRETAPTGKDEAEQTKGEKVKFVMKTYWDCAEVVPPGQPKVIDTDKMMAGMGGGGMDLSKMMQAGAKMAPWRGDGSHAYWPGSKAKPIADGAATPGPWELTTNYCGGTSLTFDEGQDFLAPLDLTSPGKGELDVEKTIKVEWKAVPNAQAYLITAFAAKDSVMVMWTSSAVPDSKLDASKALGRDEVKTYIEKGILIPPTKTSCRIPAGIFKEVGAPMLSVTAIGVDKLQEKDGILTMVTVRSMATVMLGNMGLGGAPDEAAAEEQPKDEAAGKPESTDANGDPIDKASEKANKAKDALNKLGNIFKR